MPSTLTSRLRLPASAAVLALGLSLVAPHAEAAREASAPAAAPTVGMAAGAPLTPAGGTYKATITRTYHGIPHIKAADWGSLGFGSGYATAGTSICTLADVVLTARGQRSRWLGPDKRYDDQVAMAGTNLQSDALVTDLHNRQVVEKLLADPKAGPGRQARAMVRGYAAGVNRYLRAIGGAAHISDPACRNKPWIKPNARPIDIWYGVYLANILASSGYFLPKIVDAKPPTSGVPATAATAHFAPVPATLPSRDKLLKGLGKDPNSPFGSNATAVGRSVTSTGKGMLLGNPHFPWRGRYRFTQQQLTIPGQYNVAGGSLIGSPVVNIGWNRNVAWSHTVSTAYRFTPYEYQTVGTGTTYLTTDGPRQLDHRIVHIAVKRADGSIGSRTEDMYRTPQGYVIDDSDDLMPWGPSSFFAIRDANGEQLRTIDTFLNMGKANSVRTLLAAQDTAGGMPWVNTIAADRWGNALYADHSVVPNVPEDLATKCLTPVGHALYEAAGLPGLDGTRASGECKWRTDSDAERPGIFGPKNLPKEIRSDWVINANDSYWLPNPKQPLEGFSRIIGCERCVRTLRTRMVYHYVLDRIAHSKVTPTSLRGTEHQNRVFGGELMSRNNDLVKTCQNAQGGDACTALAGWDKHSNIDSRGNQIFEQFVKRLPTDPTSSTVWQVPFDAANPVTTPRDLNENNPVVIKAMKDAIDYLRSKHVAMNATWGSLQVAGDRGAPAIPLGGGLGDQAGNANALDSRTPAQNTSYLKPVTYGSSHIQAIAFEPDGRVLARTILTYSQSENPRSKWSADQTRMFSKKQWVGFAFTPAQIGATSVSSHTVTGTY